MTDRTEADAIAEVVSKHLRVDRHVVARGNEQLADVLAMPAGLKLESLKRFVDEYRTRPERRKGVATFTELESFVAHTNRFKDADSALFLHEDRDKDESRLIAVLNYHPPGVDTARFCDHRGVYVFPLSDEWTAWKKGLRFSVAEFAVFLEDRLGDVVDPATAGERAKEFQARLNVTFASASLLLNLSRGLSVVVDAKVQNHTSLATGESRMMFEETHRGTDGEPLRVPGAFLIAIPVFRAGALYQVPVRLRYRVQGGQVTWQLEPHRLDLIFRHALEEAATQACEQTALPLYFGAPEAG